MTKAGKKPIAVRWVDVNKGDDENPNYRSRLVAKEINTGANDDLFAATPPIDALKILLRIAAYRRHNTNIFFADAKRAYFNAKATRDIYIQLPPEDPKFGCQNVCGKLELSMYGTRDAAQNWERELSSKLLLQGFTKGIAPPCLFHHRSRHIQLYVHGDDFVAVGNDKEVKWLQGQLSIVYDVKSEIMGDGFNEIKQQQILNRIVTWHKHSIEYEADPRHAEILAKIDNEGYGSKIPGSKYFQNCEHSPGVSQQDSTRYRAVIARCNFLATDRPDIQFSSK